MARAKGTPKTGGRQKGVTNKAPKFAELLAQYDHGKGFDPVTELLDIVVACKFDNPLVSSKICIALMDRLYPSLKAIEHTGADGGPIHFKLEDIIVGSIASEPSTEKN